MILARTPSIGQLLFEVPVVISQELGQWTKISFRIRKLIRSEINVVHFELHSFSMKSVMIKFRICILRKMAVSEKLNEVKKKMKWMELNLYTKNFGFHVILMDRIVGIFFF